MSNKTFKTLPKTLKRRGRKHCSVDRGLRIDTGSLMSLIDFSGKASGKASSRNDLLPENREKKNPDPWVE